MKETTDIMNFKNTSGTEKGLIEKPVVVIAAGGKGSRIASIAPDIPKPMIPIAGKPVLEWEIESLASQGFKDIILTVSYMAEKIRSYFGDGSRWNVNIDYLFEEQPLGNAGALFILLETGKLSSTFLFLIADACFDVNFARMLKFHHEHRALATLFTHPNSHPYDSGVIICDGTNDPAVVTSWLNKEDERPEFYKNRVNAGLHILTTSLLEQSNVISSNVGALQKVDLDRDVLKPLVHTGKIVAYDSPEFCRDMGVPERFYAVSRAVESGLVFSRNLDNPQKAVFLDRDGTINKYVGFLTSSSKLELIRGVAEAIKLLNNSEYLCIVCTNQPVIARGEVTTTELTAIHNKMETLLGRSGAYIDALYYCPHHPDAGFPGEVPELKVNCFCRKPNPGMLLQASRDFNIDFNNSWMIGDSWRDIRCGSNAGCKTVLLIGTGTEYEYNKCICNDQVSISSNVVHAMEADYTFSDLLSAVKMILGIKD